MPNDIHSEGSSIHKKNCSSSDHTELDLTAITASPNRLFHKRESKKRFMRTCVMVTSVILVFLITWSPYFFLKFMFLVNSDHPLANDLRLHQVAYITGIIPPVINPLLYIYQFPAIKTRFCKLKYEARKHANNVIRTITPV